MTGTDQQARAPKRLTTTAIITRYRDAVRSQESTDYGLATRPRRDLEGITFAVQLDEPWKVELANRMARHARSTDECNGPWPYDRFEEALERAGTCQPHGMTIQRAVALVDEALQASSTKWYDSNIARPLGRRAAATRSGAKPIDAGDDTHGQPHVTVKQHEYTEELVVIGADLLRTGRTPKEREVQGDRYRRALEVASGELGPRGLAAVRGTERLDEWLRDLSPVPFSP